MDAFKIFIALIALVNPLGVLPMFISLTQDFTPAQKQRAIRTAAFTVVAVISTCALLGEQIIKFFGISTASLQVADGLLILLMSLSMLNAQPSGAKTTAEERDEAEHKDTIGVVPLGIPLLTGPGAMSTVIVLAGKSNHVSDYVALIGSGVVIAAFVLTVAPELLRSFAEYRVLLFGVLMVLMMIWRPRGLIRISRVGVTPRKGVAP